MTRRRCRWRRTGAGRGGHRPGLAAVTAVIVTAGTAVVTGTLPGAPPGVARADEVTASNNPLRDGWDRNEPGLSPAVVGGGSFGQLFSTPVKGQVYAQPIVVGSTVVVATEDDWVYGLDATTGAVKWSVSLGAPWPAATSGCPNLAPNVGVTGAPVYDPANGTVYLVARVVPAGGSPTSPVSEFVGIAAQTGAITSTTPITGAPVNDPGQPFDSYTALQRAALLLLNGSVYAAFASFCDQDPYVGYVAGVNVATSAVTLWTDEPGLANGQGGIWQSSGGIMSDGPGRLFVTSGNGVSPPAGPGAAPPADLGDSVIRLGVQSDGSLKAQDFFSPANAPTLNAEDLDLGSGPPMGLPFGTSSFPHLIMQGGKDGRVWLLNRDNLGGREQGPNGSDAAVSSTGPFQGLYNNPAAFGDTQTIAPGAIGDDYVYYTGENDYLRALRFGFNSAGQPTLRDTANSTTTFGYSSGAPVVTSDGTMASSAVVWEIYASGPSGSGGKLEAFDALPQTPCSATISGPCLRMIWSAPIGTASRFSIPATNRGRVYVGTRDGRVIGFGVSASAGLVASTSRLRYYNVPVGASATKTVVITNDSTTAHTVSRVTGPTAPFTAAGMPAVGQSIAPNQSLTVSVTFTPTQAVTSYTAFTISYPGGHVTVNLAGHGL